MKYLGLDVGKKTIGVAFGELIATELLTLRAGKEESMYLDPAKGRAFDEISRIMEEEGADAIVIGSPVKEDGSASEESKKIEQFGKELEEKMGVTVHFVNETLTSFMASDILESQGVDKDEIYQRIDQVSAQLILQQFLEENALS